MKVNLGSGFNRIDGFVNVDDDPLVNPDYIVNLDDVNIKLPFEDNTVEEIVAHHILEHIGTGFIPLMQEIYRVCKHGAIIDIHVPHHFHEAYYGDPTHKRPITINTMKAFSKKFNQENVKKFGGGSGIAMKYNVDFEMIWYDFKYDSFYQGMVDNYKQRIEAGQVSDEEQFMFTRLMREATNVANDTMMKLVVIKDD